MRNTLRKTCRKFIRDWWSMSIYIIAIKWFRGRATEWIFASSSMRAGGELYTLWRSRNAFLFLLSWFHSSWSTKNMHCSVWLHKCFCDVVWSAWVWDKKLVVIFCWDCSCSTDSIRSSVSPRRYGMHAKKRTFSLVLTHKQNPSVEVFRNLYLTKMKGSVSLPLQF